MTVAGIRRAALVSFFILLFMATCSSQVFAKSCDQPAVTFASGKLSVSSNGCSFQQVFEAIKRQTGIDVVIPASASTVPIFAVVGPGDPAHVVSELLEDSPFNSTLTARSDGSGSLLKIVLTERVAFVPDQLTPAQIATQNAMKDAANKKGKDTLVADDSGDPRRRPQFDDDTLKKMPALPGNIPVAMWNLYPSLVENGGAPPTPQSSATGQTAGGLSSPLGSSPFNNGTDPVSSNNPWDSASYRKGAINLPPLPPGIDPAIAKLYPWNLMDLIRNPPPPPPTPQLQMAPPLTIPTKP